MFSILDATIYMQTCQEGNSSAVELEAVVCPDTAPSEPTYNTFLAQVLPMLQMLQMLEQMLAQDLPMLHGSMLLLVPDNYAKGRHPCSSQVGGCRGGLSLIDTTCQVFTPRLCTPQRLVESGNSVTPKPTRG